MYTVVSLTKNECLSGGNCSYIVRLSVRDLHGPTVTFRRKLEFTLILKKSTKLSLKSDVQIKITRKAKQNKTKSSKLTKIGLAIYLLET